MDMRHLLSRIVKSQTFFLLWLSCIPSVAHASIIESSMGAAVVNDATAVYFNPAALTLLKNPQIVGLDSKGYFRSEFTGQFIPPNTEFSQSGSSLTKNQYQLPSIYLGIPTKNNFTFGFAIISNFFDKDNDGNSLLRYAQSNSTIENIDFVSAAQIKLNNYFSLGANINYSYANFILRPISGIPSLNIPDSQSHNECSGTGTGWDVGFLMTPTKSTTIGFNYRSSITYELNGTSLFEGEPKIISNHYGFNFWTPARSVLSINQFLTKNLGIIGTVQRINWSIFDEINVHGIATQVGPQPTILDAKVPHHLHDTWFLTLGSHYRITPKWIVRIVSSYNQSPSNGHFQISNGDSIILATSIGYEISKYITIDGGYGHAFIQNQDIHITRANSKINGSTHGEIDVLSVKLTFNLL